MQTGSCLHSDARGPRFFADPSPGLAESDMKEQLSFLSHAGVHCIGLWTACWSLYAHQQKDYRAVADLSRPTYWITGPVFSLGFWITLRLTYLRVRRSLNLLTLDHVALDLTAHVLQRATECMLVLVCPSAEGLPCCSRSSPAGCLKPPDSGPHGTEFYCACLRAGMRYKGQRTAPCALSARPEQGTPRC